MGTDGNMLVADVADSAVHLINKDLKNVVNMRRLDSSMWPVFEAKSTRGTTVL